MVCVAVAAATITLFVDRRESALKRNGHAACFFVLLEMCVSRHRRVGDALLLLMHRALDRGRTNVAATQCSAKSCRPSVVVDIQCGDSPARLGYAMSLWMGVRLGAPLWP